MGNFFVVFWVKNIHIIGGGGELELRGGGGKISEGRGDKKSRKTIFSHTKKFLAEGWGGGHNLGNFLPQR